MDNSQINLNNKTKSFKKKNPIIFWYIIWSVIWTIIFLIMYFSDIKSKLTKEQYLIHLKEFNFDISNPDQTILNVQEKLKNEKNQIDTIARKTETEFYNNFNNHLIYGNGSVYYAAKRDAVNDAKKNYIKSLSYDYKLLNNYQDRYTNTNYAINKFLNRELVFIVGPPIFAFWIWIIINTPWYLR